MARGGGPMDVELTEAVIRVRQSGRTLTIPVAPPDSESGAAVDLVVHLDAIDRWDAPHDEIEIGIETLQKILEAIERRLDQLGLGVDFE
jgi:hypothetical protein